LIDNRQKRVTFIGINICVTLLFERRSNVHEIVQQLVRPVNPFLTSRKRRSSHNNCLVALRPAFKLSIACELTAQQQIIHKILCSDEVSCMSGLVCFPHIRSFDPIVISTADADSIVLIIGKLSGKMPNLFPAGRLGLVRDPQFFVLRCIAKSWPTHPLTKAELLPFHATSDVALSVTFTVSRVYVCPSFPLVSLRSFFIGFVKIEISTWLYRWVRNFPSE